MLKTDFLLAFHELEDARSVEVCLLFGVQFRRKMQARINELESAAEQAKGKAAKLDKDKSRLTMEIKDVSIQLDEVSLAAVDGAALSNVASSRHHQSVDGVHLQLT